MKQVKKLVLMTIMLLMGSVCLAQEVKKDSIWGLEVEFNNNSIQMSYYWDFSNNGLENTFAFKVTFRYNDKVRSTYIQYEKDELWGKMFENCKIDTISDSVWRITIYDLIPDFPSFKIQDITKISLEGEYNCNVNTIEFIPQRLSSLLMNYSAESENGRHVYTSVNGVKNLLRNQILIDSYYIGDRLVSVRKVISRKD